VGILSKQHRSDISDGPRSALRCNALDRRLYLRPLRSPRRTDFRMGGRYTRRVDQLGERSTKTANSKLKTLPKSKGGSPRKVHRDTLVQHLIKIFTEYYSGTHSRLKRRRDPDNPGCLIPDGPPYQFVCTIMGLKNIPTKGVDHVIARAQKPIFKKPTFKKE
jgi:hypothetical protein